MNPIIFIIDTNKEDLAIKEAQKLGIPIVAIIDSNCTPDGITYPIPGNDDSTRAIRMYCRLVSDAELGGIQQIMVNSGHDLGASENAGEVISPTEFEAAQEGKDEADAAQSKKSGRGGRKSADSAPAPKKSPTVMVKKTPGKK